MRILFASPRFPSPSEKGDQLRAYYLIRELSRRHRVGLVTLCDAPPAPDALAEMRRLCHRVEVVALPRLHRGLGLSHALVRREPLQIGYSTRPEARRRVRAFVAEEAPDLVHAISIRAASWVLFPRLIPTVADFIDCLSMNFHRRSHLEAGLKRRISSLEAKRLRRYEERVCDAMDAGTVVSSADCEALRSEKIRVIPNGVDAPEAPPDDAGRDPDSLVFVGNMNYFPNEDAARFLLTDILPRVWSRRPETRAYIVGRRPSNALQRLATDPRVRVTGAVERVADYLESAAVAICPMRSGSGMQNKVLEAMACAVPVIATPMALGGLSAEPGENLLVAGSAAGLADAAVRLLRSPAERARIGRRGYALVRASYSWESAARQFEEVYREVVSSVPVA